MYLCMTAKGTLVYCQCATVLFFLSCCCVSGYSQVVSQGTVRCNQSWLLLLPVQRNGAQSIQPINFRLAR